MKSKIFSILLLLSLSVGCVSLNSVSLTAIPEKRTQKVSVEKGKVIILGFNFSNDFVDDAVEDLRQQCPNGKITGLLTKDENINYFLFFVWKKRVTATGYCIPGSVAVNKTSKSKRKTASDGTEPEETETTSEGAL
jgi:hypothetical protein